MRGVVFAVVFVVVLTVTILSMRPGGIRRQLRFAARRFRIALILGGAFVVASTVIRIAFPQGPVADYGPSAIGLLAVAVFLVMGRDPGLVPNQPAPPSKE